MPLAITSIQPAAVSTPIRPPLPVAGASSSAAGVFSGIFSDAIAKVEQFRQDSQQKVEAFLSGEGEDLHTVVLSAQRAELSFELFQQVRNKVVQAYQEVMRMQM